MTHDQHHMQDVRSREVAPRDDTPWVPAMLAQRRAVAILARSAQLWGLEGGRGQGAARKAAAVFRDAREVVE